MEVNPGGEDFASANGHKMPLHIIRNPTDDMKVMQEEIFGPVLPVKTYKTIDDAIDYVNDHDRPLGLYYFGQDKSEEDRVLTRTISGGVTVNDVLFHNAMEDLPRSDEHTSELPSLMRNPYAVFCLTKKKNIPRHITLRQATT